MMRSNKINDLYMGYERRKATRAVAFLSHLKIALKFWDNVMPKRDVLNETTAMM